MMIWLTAMAVPAAAVVLVGVLFVMAGLRTGRGRGRWTAVAIGAGLTMASAAVIGMVVSFWWQFEMAVPS